MRMRALIPVLVVALTLSGCSSGTSGRGLYTQIAVAMKSAILARRGNATRPPVTRALLDEVGGNYLEVVLEREDLKAFLQPSDRRRDGSPGALVQWRTEDNVTLSFRAGVLIATRGLGGDVVSASANVADGRTGPVRSGERVMFIRTGDLQEARLVLTCELDDLGAATIEIVERRHAVRHLRETCRAPDGGAAVNDYWVGRGDGILWQSRQWAGPHIGYLRTRRLTVQ